MTTWLNQVAAGETAETNSLLSVAEQVGQMGAALDVALGLRQSGTSAGFLGVPINPGPAASGPAGEGAAIIGLLSQTLDQVSKIWTTVSPELSSQLVPPAPAAGTSGSEMSLANDAPLQVLAGDASEISSSLLSVSNNLYAGAQLIYTVTNGPTHGTLLDNGAPATRFTQADLDSGAVIYEQDGATAPADAFTFTVTDPANITVSGTFDIGITIPPPPVPMDFYGDGTSALMLGYTNGDLADMPVHDGALAGGATYLASASDGWTYLTTAANFNSPRSTNVQLMNGAGQVADYDIRNGAAVGAPTDPGTIGQGFTFLATGAFGGAGSMGVLVTDASGNLADVEVKNGVFDGNVTYVGTLTGGWKFLDAGDFSGDGSSSILITDPGGDICEWTLRHGMFAAASELTTLPSGARFLGSGDFQGTGADGLLFAGADGSVVDWSISHTPSPPPNTPAASSMAGRSSAPAMSTATARPTSPSLTAAATSTRG
jgi:hypothetical protein